MCPIVHFRTQNLFSLFFSFPRAQELSNEPHIVWFRRLLTFNPKYAQTSTFWSKFFFYFLRDIWVNRRILSYSASLCDVCIAFKSKNLSGPIRSRKIASRGFKYKVISNFFKKIIARFIFEYQGLPLNCTTMVCL